MARFVRPDTKWLLLGSLAFNVCVTVVSLLIYAQAGRSVPVPVLAVVFCLTQVCWSGLAMLGKPLFE